MITLYGVKTSRAARCLWMLEELGLGYDHVPVGFDGESRKPEFLAINPNGRVPVLVDGDLKLFESMAINLYLARRYGAGTPMALESVEQEARATMWSFWAVNELEANLLALLMNRYVYPEPRRDAAKADAAEAALAKPFAVLDAELAGTPFLAGPVFGTADLAVASVLAWAKMARYPFTDYPHVRAWLDACVKRPAALRARA